MWLETPRLEKQLRACCFRRLRDFNGPIAIAEEGKSNDCLERRRQSLIRFSARAA